MDLHFRPLTETFGAEVSGVDLSRELSSERAGVILDGFHRFGLLLFRGQAITPARQVSFSRRFGDVCLPPEDQFPLSGQPEIAVRSNVVEDGKPIGLQLEHGIEWHVDGTEEERPSIATMLFAVAVPPSGGDTLYADSSAAYEQMPPELKARVEGTRAIYNYAKHYEMMMETSGDDYRRGTLTSEQHEDFTAAIVRRHPETGRKALVFSPEECVGIEGAHGSDYRALMDELTAWISQPRFVYRHAWRTGDLVVCDNRCTLHSPTEYTYRGFRRIMHRTTTRTPAAPGASSADGL